MCSKTLIIRDVSNFGGGVGHARARDKGETRVSWCVKRVQCGQSLSEKWAKIRKNQ